MRTYPSGREEATTQCPTCLNTGSSIIFSTGINGLRMRFRKNGYLVVRKQPVPSGRKYTAPARLPHGTALAGNGGSFQRKSKSATTQNPG